MGDTNLDIFGDQGHGSDPFGTRNAFKMHGGLGDGGYSQRPQAQYTPLKAEEAAPLKEGLLSRSISGLHYVGSSLDKAFGARALRGLAAGKPHELLSAIPFSDTMGLTKPEDAVSMDDLLTKHYNVFKPNDPNKWEFRDFAIPALEIAADPGTWMMPMGAATKAGKLAAGLGHTQGMTRQALTKGFDATEVGLRAAGHTPEQIAHMANQGQHIAGQALTDAAQAAGITLDAGTPLRGSVGFGMPFRDASTTLGHGKLAQGIAGAQDWAGRKLAEAPGVANLRALFDPAAMRAESAAVQESASRFGVPAREAVSATTRAGEYELRTQMDRLMKGFQTMPGVETEALRLMRGAAEGASPIYSDKGHWQADLMRRHGTNVAPGRTMAGGVQDPHAVANHILANWDQIQAMGGNVRKFGEDLLRNSQDAGLNANALDDLYAHYNARRYIAAAPGFGGTDVGKQFPTMHGSNTARKQPLRDIPGGSEQLNEWAMNPSLSGANRKLGPTVNPAVVHQTLVDDMMRHETLMKGAAGITPDDVLRIDAKAKEVAAWLKSVPDIHAEKGIHYFNPDLIGDYAMRGQRHATVSGSAAAAIDAGTKMSRPTADFLAGGERHVGLGDFFADKGRAGLHTGVRTDAAGNPEFFGAGMRAWEKMAPKGFDPVSMAHARPGGPIKAKLPYWQEKLNEHALSEADANQISRFLQGWAAPTETKPFLGALGGAHQLFKNMVYPLWPASHFRNAVSAAYNNFLHGTNIGDYADAYKMMRKGVVADPARYAQTAAMTPQDAAHFLNKGAYADAKVYSGVNSFEEHVGGRGLNDERLTKGLMGEERLIPQAPGVQPSLRSIAAKNGWQNFNPLAQSGLFGQTEDKFLPLLMGRRAGSGIEDYVRMSNYLGNLRQGMNSSKAGQLTRNIHFDYSNMTPFEKNVMKQVVPFYTFMRNNLPYQAHMAATKPGSVSPMLHAMQATNPNQPWVPEYLAANAAIPVGQEQDGNQRYIGSFGLPLEEAASRFKFKNGLPDLAGTASAFLGDASPYLKAPIEAMTDTSLKTGRKLSDLTSNRLLTQGLQMPEEYAQPLTQALANSPLARFMTSGQTIADERKGWGTKAMNLLTGVRLTDVDIDRQRNATMRAEINEILKKDPRIAEFVNYYVRPEMKGQMTPELTQQMRLFGTLKQDSKAHHKHEADQAKLKALYGGKIPTGF